MSTEPTVVAQLRNGITSAHVAVIEDKDGYGVTCEACGPVTGSFGDRTTESFYADRDALEHSKTCAKLPRRLWIAIDGTVNS